MEFLCGRRASRRMYRLARAIGRYCTTHPLYPGEGRQQRSLRWYREILVYKETYVTYGMPRSARRDRRRRSYSLAPQCTTVAPSLRNGESMILLRCGTGRRDAKDLPFGRIAEPLRLDQAGACAVRRWCWEGSPIPSFPHLQMGWAGPILQLLHAITYFDMPPGPGRAYARGQRGSSSIVDGDTEHDKCE